jgi:hypothetical protein
VLNRNFTFCEDADRGYWGLKADWMPNADPFDGLGCAHDCLEHFATQTEPIEGECEALGAHMFLRLENGWAAKNRISRQETWYRMGGLLSSCLTDMADQGLDKPTLLLTRPLPASSEAELQQALDEAFRLAKGDYDESDYQARLAEPGLREAVASWVRSGYRRAAKRYAKKDTFEISDRLFDRVAKSLDTLITEYLQPGDKVGVSLDLRLCEVHVRINGRRANDLLCM